MLTELDKLVELKFYGLPEGVNFNIFIFDAETHNLLVKLEKLQEDLSSVVGAKKLAPRDRSGWGRNLSGRGHALLYDIERLMYMLSYIK